MQVMNHDEFEDTTVLVGQAGASQKFGVSDDPMLMSMLSTGLYANPHRTMIQEIIFNAWDAHRMGNCQDTPIDIYVNENSGFIVRDYGPGIHPDAMTEIYCIYGNSTKRNDQNQTGGFGLGSKSPFAYTETFTVTSMHGGKKSMYLVKRVSEDNNGGPGMTAIISGADTEESGLMVTVPLKSERDKQKTYTYLKEILFLSGIKANIHYEGEAEVELVESISVPPNTYLTDNQAKYTITALYGGVHYEIPDTDEYHTEYKFLRKLSQYTGNFVISFPPDSLTPLPNREGLNLSEKSIESIQVQLERIYEQFRAIFEPATEMMLSRTLDHFKATEIQPHFLAYRWNKIGNSNSHNLDDLGELEDIYTPVFQNRPSDIIESVWDTVCKLIYQHTNVVSDMMGTAPFETIKSKLWLQKCKEFRHLSTQSVTPFSYQELEQVLRTETESTVAEMITHQRKLEAELDVQLEYRALEYSRSRWKKLTNNRAHKKVVLSKATYRDRAKLEDLYRQNKISTQEKLVYNKLWIADSGELFDAPMLKKHVILAKTATALENTGFKWQEYFSPLYADHTNHYSKYNYTHFFNRSSHRMILSMVIHRRKGMYDRAKEYFESQGFTVIEADEPEEPKVPSQADFIGPMLPVSRQKKQAPQFPIVQIGMPYWADDAKMTDSPDAYFCCTKREFDSYGSYKPERDVMRYMLKICPNIVILHTRVKERTMIKNQVPELTALIANEVDRLLADTARMDILYQHKLVDDNTDLPPFLLALPEMHQYLQVPVVAEADFPQLKSELLFLNSAASDSFVNYPTRQKLKKAFADLDTKLSASLVRHNARNTKLFSEYAIRSRLNEMQPAAQKDFALKLIQFMTTV